MTTVSRDLTFTSHGVTCAAWHLPARTDALAGPDGRPAIVLGHGFGGTRDTGLLAFAEPLADAGIDALVFDYRGFGDSDGTPRQHVAFARQREDYHSAVAVARHLPGVDAVRIALWGTSYSGGHALVVAAQDRHIAAVVALTPAVDGFATLKRIRRHDGLGRIAALTVHGLRDVVCTRTRRTPHTVPIVGPPDSTALITTPGAHHSYTAIAGPTWRNEVCARTTLEVARNRPTAYAKHVRCPVLFQVGSNDRVAPPDAARRAANKAGRWAHLHEYPVDHFDVYQTAWREQVLADQLTFLEATLRPKLNAEPR